MSESNLITIGSWQNHIETKREMDSIGKYLNVLTAGELIRESQHLISEIHNGNVSSEITNRYERIRDEFKKRVGTNSPSKAMALQETSEKIASSL